MVGQRSILLQQPLQTEPNIYLRNFSSACVPSGVVRPAQDIVYCERRSIDAISTFGAGSTRCCSLSRHAGRLECAQQRRGALTARPAHVIGAQMGAQGATGGRIGRSREFVLPPQQMAKRSPICQRGLALPASSLPNPPPPPNPRPDGPERSTTTFRYGIRLTRLLSSGTGGPPKPREPQEAPARPAVGSTARGSG